jgi:hypothetical protein
MPAETVRPVLDQPSVLVGRLGIPPVAIYQLAGPLETIPMHGTNFDSLPDGVEWRPGDPAAARIAGGEIIHLYLKPVIISHLAIHPMLVLCHRGAWHLAEVGELLHDLNRPDRTDPTPTPASSATYSRIARYVSYTTGQRPTTP